MWALSSTSLLVYCSRISQTYPELADTVKLVNQLVPRILSLSSKTRIGEGGLAHSPCIYMSYGALNSGSQACLANTFNYWAVSPAPTFLYVKALRVISHNAVHLSYVKVLVMPPSSLGRSLPVDCGFFLKQAWDRP